MSTGILDLAKESKKKESLKIMLNSFANGYFLVMMRITASTSSWEAQDLEPTFIEGLVNSAHSYKFLLPNSWFLV